MTQLQIYIHIATEKRTTTKSAMCYFRLRNLIVNRRQHNRISDFQSLLLWHVNRISYLT